MFTGIVEELGHVESLDSGRLRIAACTVLDDVEVGASIAVNGCCLTVVDTEPGWWEADVSDETLERTNLDAVGSGDPVNLERSVRLADRLGGHVVQGHVDGIGEIVTPVPDLRVRVPGGLLRYIVEKGSITVDGVSLTVVSPLEDGFTVAIIPHTRRGDHTRPTPARRRRQPRSRRDGEVRRAARDRLRRPGRAARYVLMTVDFDPIEQAIAAIGRGQIVVVADDEARENEGDLIMAADAATTEDLTFFVRHTSGVICIGLTGERCDALRLSPMVAPTDNTESHGTAFTVSVDLTEGTTTGISAGDRAATLRALADPTVDADAFNRPGHIFPLRARPGGVLKRAGHTEAAVDLARLAGRSPAGILCELVLDGGEMARGPELRRFADRHGLLLVSITDLIRHRRRSEKLVTRTAEARLPTRWGEFPVPLVRECARWADPPRLHDR